MNAEGLKKVHDGLFEDAERDGPDFFAKRLKDIFVKRCKGEEWTNLKEELSKDNDNKNADLTKTTFEEIPLRGFEQLTAQSYFRFNRIFTPGIALGRCYKEQPAHADEAKETLNSNASDADGCESQA